MNEPNGYMQGVPCWVDTWQPDADAAVDFYKTIFGWEAEDTMPEDVSGKHYMCRLRGLDVAAVASRPEHPPEVTVWTTYVWVDDVDETIEKVKEAGGSVVKEPSDSLDVGRVAVIADPAGAALGIWQPGEHRGAQAINEPSAWAMSRLSTDDPEAAKRFYESAFGWDHETFVAGGAEMTLWKVPGYVGGLPQQPVARDVVAIMGPAGENGDAPPHWGVDFWIADVDAAATTATERGARIVAGPYDIPEVGMRRVKLIDPQGAAIALTQPPSGD
ncbi:MAG TPA: VOC family protein [Solirubrobacterales bacterium]|jgi:predicted enzyme related to lactoylglutathione lyase